MACHKLAKNKAPGSYVHAVSTKLPFPVLVQCTVGAPFPRVGPGTPWKDSPTEGEAEVRPEGGSGQWAAWFLTPAGTGISLESGREAKVTEEQDSLEWEGHCATSFPRALPGLVLQRCSH